MAGIESGSHIIADTSLLLMADMNADRSSKYRTSEYECNRERVVNIYDNVRK
jgi:hypothetical protein